MVLVLLIYQPQRNRGTTYKTAKLQEISFSDWIVWCKMGIDMFANIYKYDIVTYFGYNKYSFYDILKCQREQKM